MEKIPIKETKGLSVVVAGLFIVAQLAGAGFVSLPKALGNTGWLGLPMMILFCVMVGLSATRLGFCWNILEERWPDQYSQPARQPYMEIAEKAFGKHGRAFALFCVVASQFGGTTVFIILAAELLNTLLPGLSTCVYIIIVATIITPCTWLGTPKDFWLGPMLAVVSTIAACLAIFVQTLLDAPDQHYVQFVNPTIKTFALGYGAILFAFGGSSVFPTIQNDMSDRTQFWKSVLLGFSSILLLYVPVSVAGYAVFGTYVNSNILFEVTQGPAVEAAMALQIINLLGSYVIGFNTVTQAFEDILNIPQNFGVKRIVTRTSIVWLQAIIGLAIPDFSLILNLIGGSAMTICSFILPPLMYLVLTRPGPKYDGRPVPFWMRVALIEIVIIGAIGGTFSTVSAIVEIVNTPFSASCFADFSGDSL
ncbi:amino acid transporter AVT1B [Hyalella azteca]|uniref:Amino acid transporter AVT1B n=1 Tax=Hyalella azteca TaxID=294128 RepID=A0A8B7P7J6_HYAAZ|nr:amino acid transporter AVT1B [Hyalella azteca]